MKKNVLSALAVSAAIACFAAPALAQNIAIVNGKAVPKERMEALAQQFARSGQQITPEMQGQLRDEVIAREVFAQEAHNLGLDAKDDFKNQIELARQSILIRELFAEFQKKNTPSDEEIKAEYDKLAAANASKEYHAHHILVEKEATAKDIIAKLKKGAKFEVLAKQLSKDPGSAVNGGDLNWANPQGYVPEFSQAMVALAKGAITETPVKSQYGFHVIRLDDVRDAQLPKLEEVKGQLLQRMVSQKLSTYQQELRAKARVE
jgi:peptidyl-prolyl cis-trans isomerase C